MEDQITPRKRLKHFHYQQKFYIDCNKPDLQQKILENVYYCITINLKRQWYGHTKDEHIKKYDKDCVIVKHNSGWVFELTVHVQHYSDVCFDEPMYISLLNASLLLVPGSITTTIPPPIPFEDGIADEEVHVELPPKRTIKSYGCIMQSKTSKLGKAFI